jgi:3-hydroxyacyl-CoA dehydrogenase / enoyl-CoA hydratase / 3-hydroxybutyryl-CoA epimerase
MTSPLPELTQFHVEPQPNGLVHFIFDCPDRSMNVFSNKAIHELGRFAEWLHRADDIKGVVIRSGKPTGFCAGADLNELAAAYEVIVAAPLADRFDIAFNHFFPLSHAIRRLETAGKPVAAAIGGVALGGGCELAMGAHFRVATSSARAILGLPEHAVGLLPGGGGTQRMPRLIGVEAGLDVLLLGQTFQGQEALEIGLLHAVVDEGDEVAAAERWLISGQAHCTQPWDAADHVPLPHSAIADVIQRDRKRELARMLGHEPAPLAILDCVEFGVIQSIEGGIRAEMSVFSELIQRPEPRNMIRTMFIGKQAFDKARKDGSLASKVDEAEQAISTLVEDAATRCPELRQALFAPMTQELAPVRTRAGKGFWVLERLETRQALAELADACSAATAALDEIAMLQLDHALARDGIIPAYVGGIKGLRELTRNDKLVDGLPA